MQKQRYNLIELASDLGTSVEELIGYGADGELTVYVIADEWPRKKAGNSDAKSAGIVDGQVELLPIDLLKALSSEYTEVRQVKTADGDVIELDSPQKVARGVHFVTAAERDRVLDALKSKPQTAAATSEDVLTPYLDPLHPYYTETLNAAVKAWLALYVEGGFKPKGLGHIEQLEAWLSKHYPDLSNNARKNIATVANYNKDGGNPTTRKN